MGGVPYVLERYMVAFHYGSLVFLNFDAGEQDAVLNDVQPFCDVHFRGAHKDGEGERSEGVCLISVFLLGVGEMCACRFTFAYGEAGSAHWMSAQPRETSRCSC